MADHARRYTMWTSPALRYALTRNADLAKTGPIRVSHSEGVADRFPAEGPGARNELAEPADARQAWCVILPKQV